MYSISKYYSNREKAVFIFLSCIIIMFSGAFCNAEPESTSRSDPNTLELNPKMMDGSEGVKSQVRDCTMDASGNIYCAGNVESVNGHKDIFVVKIKSSHSVDTNWGTNGYIILNPASSNTTHDEEDFVNAIAVYNDDSLIIAGQSRIIDDSNRHTLVVKLNKSTGEYDTTFNGTGILIWDGSIEDDLWNRDEADADDEAECIAIDLDNYIYIAGSARKLLNPAYTTNDMFVIKLNSIGRFVDTFGTLYDKAVPAETAGNGVFGYNGTENKGDKARDISLDTDGNIYITGSTRNTLINGGEDLLTVMKLTPDGDLDTDFDTDGVAFVDIETANSFKSEAKALTINSDAIYITGTGEKTQDNDYDMVLAALNISDGSAVSGFGNDGYVTKDGAYNNKDDEGRCIGVGSDGYIYISGYIENGTNRDRKVWQFDNIGFQTNQIALPADGYDDEINSLLIDNDNNLIMGGYKDDITAIVWFQTIE